MAAGGTGTRSGELPRTGSDLAPAVTLGLAAVVVGAVIVWGSRRSRRSRRLAGR